MSLLTVRLLRPSIVNGLNTNLQFRNSLILQFNGFNRGVSSSENNALEPKENKREQSIQKIIEELGFNPLQDLYGLKSMTTNHRNKYLQRTIVYEEFERRRQIDFPQLRARAQPWVPPTKDNIFELKHYTYLLLGGDPTHPRGWKVKVTFRVSDLAREYNLDETAVKKVKLIAGARYDPDSDVVKIVCQHRPNRKQNQERIEKMIARLITSAKDKSETFDDIPVEAIVSLTRKPKKAPIPYPESWKIYQTQNPKSSKSTDITPPPQTLSS